MDSNSIVAAVSLISLFARLVIILTFTISSIHIISHFHLFEQTVNNFISVSKKISKPVAIVVLMAEVLTIVLVIIGSTSAMYGYILALLLLIIFTAVLMRSMKVKIRSSCNCFGVDTIPVSSSEIVRNVGFMICAVIGILTGVSLKTAIVHVDVFSGLFALVLSVLYVLLLINLKVIISVIS